MKGNKITEKKFIDNSKNSPELEINNKKEYKPKKLMSFKQLLGISISIVIGIIMIYYTISISYQVLTYDLINEELGKDCNTVSKDMAVAKVLDFTNDNNKTTECVEYCFSLDLCNQSIIIEDTWNSDHCLDLCTVNYIING